MAGGRIFGLRWITIALIMLGAIINYLTRNALGVAAPTMLDDLRIGEIEYSYVILAFQLAIACQPVVGYMLDTLGMRAGMVICAVVWSVSSMLHGLVHNWPMLAALRSVMGFAEGSANPAGMKITSVWFPAKERGFAAGFYNIGASFGSLLAPPLVGWAILVYNWQTAFIITGSLGMAWALVWFLFYRAPDRQKLMSDKERAYIHEGQEAFLKAEAKRPSFLRILRQRNFWGIALPRFLADPTWGTLSFWLPLYLSQARGFDLKGIAMFAWMPFLAADLGCFFGPAIVHFLQKRGVSLIDARRSAFTLGAIMMIGVMFAGFVKDPYVAIALISLAGFAHQTLSVTVITMASDLYKQNEVATVAGMAGTFGNVGLMLFSLLIGSLVLTIGYAPFFVALGVLDIVGAIVVWSVVRDPAKDQTIPFALPLAAGALLAGALALFVKARETTQGTSYYVGELVEKTFLFHQWVYVATWAFAIVCVLFGLYLMFRRATSAKPKPV
jgi:ACS family hexuronate transporter-like MFS transporter